MLTYDMQNRGNASLYEHLYMCIRDDIEAGRIALGERLPSKRALAKHLGISVITVEGAYAQLVAEGYVNSVPRKGFFASFTGSPKALSPKRTAEQMFHVKHLDEERAAKERAAGGYAAEGRVAEGRASNGLSCALGAEEALLSSREGGNNGKQMFHVKHSEGLSEALGLSEPLASSGFSPLSVSADSAPMPTPWADFTGATAARGLFPYKTWARTVREALSAESERSLLEASDPAGAPQLRRALADYLRGFRGMEVSPQQIVVGAGAQSLYALIIQLLGRSRAYAVENPGYPRLAHIYRSNDVRLDCIPLDDGGVNVDALAASGASVVHCMPSHQFPTGLVTSASRRHELLQWAMQAQEDETNVSRETFSAEETRAGDTNADTSARVGGGALAGADAPAIAGARTVAGTGARAVSHADANVDERRYIIEDDYDCEFRMAGRPIPSLQSIDEAECVIYTNTFTKSLGPAFRIGYMVLPDHLARRFHEQLGFYSCTVGAIDQLALARFIESGEYERHVNRLRNRHRRVQDALISGLRASSVGDMLRFVHVGAGLHFLMEVDLGENTPEECARRTNYIERAGRAERMERARCADPTSRDEYANCRESERRERAAQTERVERAGRVEHVRRAERVIAERARERGIALAPLSDYWLDSPDHSPTDLPARSPAGLSSDSLANSPVGSLSNSPDNSPAGLPSYASSNLLLHDEYSSYGDESRSPTFVMNFTGIEEEEVARVVETLAQVLSAIK